MNVDYGIWSKLTRVVIILIVVAAALLVFNWYLPLIQQNERMRKDILNLETQIKQEQETSRELQAEIDAIRSDPKAVERLARDKFGYAKPDETVVRFEDPATNLPVAH
jgi:cell division protein FtsB